MSCVNRARAALSSSEIALQREEPRRIAARRFDGIGPTTCGELARNFREVLVDLAEIARESARGQKVGRA